jgi:hypothetical protein
MVAIATRFAGTGWAVTAFLCLAACSGGGFEGTVLCPGQSVEVTYHPADGVAVTMAERRIGSADAGDRELDEEECETVATQTGWFVGISYTKIAEPVGLQCRFPSRFFLHAQPTYSSESGELFPDGSALYVVVPKRNTIVVSASIAEDDADSRLMFSKRYCTVRSAR